MSMNLQIKTIYVLIVGILKLNPALRSARVSISLLTTANACH